MVEVDVDSLGRRNIDENWRLCSWLSGEAAVGAVYFFDLYVIQIVEGGNNLSVTLC